VEWRGRRFWVGLDMKVHEILEEGESEGTVVGESNAQTSLKGKGSVAGTNGVERRNAAKTRSK
jgi:hypothetical protein